VERESDTAGDVGLAFLFGIGVELLSWALQEFVGVLPEPFSHFIPGLGVDDYNATVLKDCLLFSAIVVLSCVGIWFCVKKAEGLANSKLRRVFLLLGILVVGCAVSYYDKHERPERSHIAPCTVAAPHPGEH
jgi:hypothetical protein